MIHVGFITFLIAMIAITNPIGNAAIFIGMTADKTAQEQKQIAVSCFFSVLIILLVVAWGGHMLLVFFGISLGAIECAGGLILILIGLSMMKDKPGINKVETKKNKPKSSIAIVPLAIPIVAGPGAMATLIAHAQNFHNIYYLSVTSLICLITALVVGVCFYFSAFIAKFLGPIGIQIALKVMGLVIISIAFQLLSSGLLEFFPVLSMHAT